MNKFLSIALLFSSISYADVDIGDDFTAGDLVAADEFNAKVWECFEWSGW